MYSHLLPAKYGETMHPMEHSNTGSPWIDEVQQSVCVNTRLDKNAGTGVEFFPLCSDGNDKAQCKILYSSDKFQWYEIFIST